jgi:hypothetical protein
MNKWRGFLLAIGRKHSRLPVTWAFNPCRNTLYHTRPADARGCALESKRDERCVLAPTGASPVDMSAYRRAPRNAAGLPGGVPPLEMARQRVGLKVDQLLCSTLQLLLRGSDLRHAPPRPFGLRPSASHIDTNRAFARHEQFRFFFDPSSAALRLERS